MRLGGRCPLCPLSWVVFGGECEPLACLVVQPGLAVVAWAREPLQVVDAVVVALVDVVGVSADAIAVGVVDSVLALALGSTLALVSELRPVRRQAFAPIMTSPSH